MWRAARSPLAAAINALPQVSRGAFQQEIEFPCLPATKKMMSGAEVPRFEAKERDAFSSFRHQAERERQRWLQTEANGSRCAPFTSADLGLTSDLSSTDWT